MLDTDFGVVSTEAKREAVRIGVADANSGRKVPYSEVRAWMQSWGTSNELPMPSVCDHA